VEGVNERDRAVGRYRLLRKIGAGGMSDVYLGFDRELDRNVAVKLMAPWQDDKSFRRMQREARAMAQLNHPNVVSVYEVGEHDGRCYIAMELVEGPTIDAWIEEVARPWSEVVRVFLQAGRGLAAAHRAGMVHRDFKPSNVMIGMDQRARVMDFGLAIPHTQDDDDGLLAPSLNPVLEAMRDPITEIGFVSGTPAYMSPEQHAGFQASPACDQFAFGVSMWEALFKQRPYPGKTAFAIVRSIEEGNLADPPRSRVPGWLVHILRRAVAYDADDRYDSMESLLAAIVFTARVLHS
jgi:serine/threonine protein kinase